MSFTIEFEDSGNNSVPIPDGVSITPRWLSARAVGGSEKADLDATGNTSALWAFARYLGYRVKVRNRDSQVVWSGFVEGVTINLGAISAGISLAGMFNRVAVAYTTPSSSVGGSQRFTTAWAENTDSINRYGYKELKQSISDVNTAQAEGLRDTVLAALSKPTPTVGIGGDERGATIHCRGWIATLGWRYYEQLAGLEEYTTGGDDQPIGLGLTGATIGFTEDGRIHDTANNLDAFISGHNVTVTGSTSNNGTYLLEGVTVDGESYTATTIELDPTDDINDSAAGMGFLGADDIITLSGTISQDGVRYLTSAAAGHLTVNIPPNITTEAAGPSITIAQAGSIRTDATGFTYELPGASVTLTVHGQKVAQSFTLSANTSWTVATIGIRLKIAGTPGDNIKVELCSDSAGAPGSVLDSASVVGNTISDSMAWVEFVMANTQTIAYGTTYWLVLSRTGSNHPTNYYITDVDEDLGYSGGLLKVWTGSAWTTRATDGDLAFRILGAIDTTAQIDAIYDACGQFLQAIDIVDASGIVSNQYRDGDQSGLDELSPLLETGTSAGLRLIATITPERVLRIQQQSVSNEDNLLLSSDGIVRNVTGVALAPGALPAARWVRLSDVPGNVDALAAIANIFVESAEYNIDNAELRLEPQGQRDPWDMGSISRG